MRRWMWVVTIVSVVLSLVAGWVVAQEGLEYPYLSAEYSTPYTATLAEWRGLQLTAHWNSPGGLTERLQRVNLTARVRPDGLLLVVVTLPQASWNTYRGAGRFSCSDEELTATYQQAGEATMPIVEMAFPDISSDDVTIEFFVLGTAVGTWHGGTMVLAGEDSSD